jgi:N-acetylneuraminic acid mutarotase
MPNIASVLKEEILRLARKEARSETNALKKASAQYRRDIAALKRQITDLQRKVAPLMSVGEVDGKVYVFGGTGGGSALTTVEEYDPATDTWAHKAGMPTIRAVATSSAVNGKIYVMGGKGDVSGPDIASVYEYNPAMNTWTSKASMLTPRSYLSSSAANGKIYAIGGTHSYPGAGLSTVEEYDPATDTWTRKADMPTPRATVSTSEANGKIYARGGSLGGSGSQWYVGLTTVEEYDPATDTWTRKASMPIGRTHFSTWEVNGKIYVIGGINSAIGGNHIAQVDMYDPETDTWTRKADMPTARSGLSSAAANGKIYALGGWIGNSTTVATVEEYDPYPLVVDLNGDGVVDGADLCIMVDYWGTDEPLCDIGPMPWGDGVVDVQDLIVLGEYLLTYPGALAYWRLDEMEGDIAYDSVGDNDALLVGNPAGQSARSALTPSRS